MSALEDYAERYTLVGFVRRDGILQMTFHTDGGSLRWGAEAISQMQAAFADVADDAENRVVILTGAGDEFNGPKGSPETFPGATPRGWEGAHLNTRRLLRNLLEIEAPVIAAINGPVWRHCETPLLSDIVVAADTVVFQDSGHFVNGLVPGDGMNLVLPLVMGPTRARYFMLTGQQLTARQALDYGIVNEVVPVDAVLPRAWELARQLIRQSPLVLRYTRVCLVHTIRQLLVANQGYGVMLEGMAAIDDQHRAGYTLDPRI
jgi:enoyl-CoA hydratase/carnithine racemase